MHKYLVYTSMYVLKRTGIYVLQIEFVLKNLTKKTWAQDDLCDDLYSTFKE